MDWTKTMTEQWFAVASAQRARIALCGLNSYFISGESQRVRGAFRTRLRRASRRPTVYRRTLNVRE